MASDDGGHRWFALGNTTAPSKTTKLVNWSEQQMTRLAARGPHELMMTGHGQGNHASDSNFLVAYSHDFGTSWSVPTPLPPDLKQPGCQGSLLATSATAGAASPPPGSLLQVGDLNITVI